MTNRRVARTYPSIPTVEGAGVHLKRAFGHSHVPQFDPFLMLDDFHTSNPDEYLPGFPWHPHRGIETITYILEGLAEHGDSMGNRGTIGAGEIQWMTAGSGIIHQEMPKISPTGTLWGFQFWANLPASSKMIAPRYRDVKATDIPELELRGGVRIKIVAGEIEGISGPVRDIVIDPGMLDVSVPAAAEFSHALPAGHTAFAYILAGEARFDDRPQSYGPETVLLFERTGETVKIEAGENPVRLLLISGRPLNEPIAWYGPIVMNTQEELQLAFDEFRAGTFIK
jgi:hypothetical protein